nr:hypothetical protein [uncultured Blautia sp.]
MKLQTGYYKIRYYNGFGNYGIRLRYSEGYRFIFWQILFLYRFIRERPGKKPAALEPGLLRGVIAIAASAVILSGVFGINGVWSSFLSSEIITFVVLLVLAKSRQKKAVDFV